MITTPTRPPITVTERRSKLAGYETRVLEAGASDGVSGPPFLLIHGFADSGDTWRALMPKLAEAGRPVMAIDLPGFGAGGPVAAGRPLLPQWDRVVAAAAIELAREHSNPVHIAGNSLGGCLAIRAAQDPGLPIAGVIPIAPAGLHMARWFPIIEGERLIRLLQLSPLPVPEIMVREVVGRVYVQLAFADSRRASEEAIASFTRHIPSVTRGTAVLDLGRRMLPELEQPFELDRIEAPLLLIWGDRDRMVYTTGAERVLRTVPYSDIEVIENCGHCPQVELPERMAELLLSFPEEFEHRPDE